MKKEVLYKSLKQSKRGVTLIALVVTIVVLMILAGISVKTLSGENGIISKVKEAEEKQIIAELEEKIQLERIQLELNANSTEEILIGMITCLKNIGIKGIYSINISQVTNTISIKTECIIENDNKLYRCDLILEGEDLDFIEIENLKKIKKIDEMAEPMFIMFTEPERAEKEINMLNRENTANGSIVYISYKEKMYDIIISFNLSENNPEIIAFIKEHIDEDLENKKWKDIYIAYRNAYAIDSDGQVWKWEGKNGAYIQGITPINLTQTMYNIKFENFIEGNIPVVQEISGKVYIIKEFDNEIVCLNDYFNNTNKIQIKKVIESGYENYYILDENGELWFTNLEEIEKGVIKIDIETTFKDIEKEPWTYEYDIIALDLNGKIWRFDEKTSDAVSDNVDDLKNKKIKIIGDYIVTEDNQVLGYNGSKITNLNESNSILNDIDIKEVEGSYLTDVNGNIFEIDEETVTDVNTLGLCDGNKIIEIYQGAWGGTALDENNVIWVDSDGTGFFKESEQMKKKTLVKTQGTSIFMAIDSDGNLYTYGRFLWPE